MNFDHILKRKNVVKKGIYSYAHEIADKICEYLGDYKEFGLWVKKGKELGAGVLLDKFNQMKSKGIKSSHYLLKCCK